MEYLLQNPIFRAKMKSLSPSTRRWFIDALIDLFDQESEFVIDVIEDCREEMRDTADRYRDEADNLRAQSRMLREKRENKSPSPTRSMSRISAPSRLLYVTERQGTQDSLRIGQRRRRMVMSDDDSGRVSSLSVPSLPALTPVNQRLPSPSARSTRSLPVTPSPSDTPQPPPVKDEEEERKKMHEETRVLLQTMNDRENKAEKERERQQERLERIRRQKRYLAEDRTQQALKLLEKALEMDKALARDKERQELQLRSKLDDMKKKRGQQKQDAEYVEIIELQEK